jgi:uncharacterized protein (TIGR00299 family) protein
MRIAYFDIICGAAGDMILASMLDAGLDLEKLRTELSKLPLQGYSLTVEKVKRHHISSTLLKVKIDETLTHRTLADIEEIIDESRLADRVKSRAKNIFRRLAEAEAKVHGETVETVHFHEVGMVDAIIDICGASIGFDLLGIDKIYCSSLTIGKGTIVTRHGTMPVPAPATSELIAGFPIKQTAIDSEILTPTGTAILTTLADFSSPPPYRSAKSGYGAGFNDHKELPNLLRLVIGDVSEDFAEDTICLLETNLDRNSPEEIGYLMNRLLEAGALDVFITPIQMKKNRPGQMLSVIYEPDDEKKLADIVFGSGCTLGIRRNQVNRWKLPREEKIINTQYGEIPVKLATYDNKLLYFPEYENVAEAARKYEKNFDEIYFEILSLLRKET